MTFTLETRQEVANGTTVMAARQTQRWLHVVSHTHPRYGGLSAAVPALVSAMSERGRREVQLAAFCHPEEAFRPSVVAAEDISFWPASRLAWWKDRALTRRFEAMLRGEDGVHVHGLWEASTAIACGLARRAGKPYVLSAHGMLEPWALAAKKRKKQLYAALVERSIVTHAACLHALTAVEVEQYRSFGARGPIAVVPNAVEIPQEASAEPFLQQFPDLRAKRVVLFLSRLHPKKGLDLLLRAWARLRVTNPDAHLVLAGSGAREYEAELQATVRDQDLLPAVTFAGLLAGERKWSAMKAAEAFVLPSYSEGLPMALLEAMGMGLPVIATRACNMPEISAANAGWEIDALVDELAGALQTLLAQAPADNKAKGQRGAQLIASRYTRAEVVRQTAAMYDAVLGHELPQGAAAWSPDGVR